MLKNISAVVPIKNSTPSLFLSQALLSRNAFKGAAWLSARVNEIYGENKVEYLRWCATREEARVKFLRDGTRWWKEGKCERDARREERVIGRSIAKTQIADRQRKRVFLSAPFAQDSLFFLWRNKTDSHLVRESLRLHYYFRSIKLAIFFVVLFSFSIIPATIDINSQIFTFTE